MHAEMRIGNSQSHTAWSPAKPAQRSNFETSAASPESPGRHDHSYLTLDERCSRLASAG